MFQYVNDDITPISKDEILKYLSQEEIFDFIFPLGVNLYEKYTSPFREDTIPGAYFNWYNNVLYFVDWADTVSKFTNCFEAIQRFYKFEYFQMALDFIYYNFIENKNLIPRSNTQIVEFPKFKKASLEIATRAFTVSDKSFWMQYGISFNNLKEDKVYSVREYIIHKDLHKHTVVYTCCFAYTDFEEGRMKLYFPFKENRFISTCNKNDIGHIKSWIPNKKTVISKSYKDSRVLKNLGINSIWLQSEGVIPDSEEFNHLINNSSELIIFYDNDNHGREASLSLQSKIPNSRVVYLPNHKDPSDFIVAEGKEKLTHFLKENNLYEI